MTYLTWLSDALWDLVAAALVPRHSLHQPPTAADDVPVRAQPVHARAHRSRPRDWPERSPRVLP